MNFFGDVKEDGLKSFMIDGTEVPESPPRYQPDNRQFTPLHHFSAYNDLQNYDIEMDDKRSPIGPFDGSDKRRVNTHNYLQHSQYLNNMLVSLSFLPSSELIDFDFCDVNDKVNVMNGILQLLESRSLYKKMLSQSREETEKLLRQFTLIKSKNKKLSDTVKKSQTQIQRLDSFKSKLEQENKQLISKTKERIKTVSKENELHKQKLKQFEIENRKLQRTLSDLQQKYKKILHEKEKHCYSKVGMTCLNQFSTVYTGKEIKEHKKDDFLIKSHQKQHRALLAENSILQSQLSQSQKNVQTILDENMQLRRTLLEIEINCKDAVSKVVDELGEDVKCKSTSLDDINQEKYHLPLDTVKEMIQNDIDACLLKLQETFDSVRKNENDEEQMEKTERYEMTIKMMTERIAELEKTNQEYEDIIQKYCKQDGN